MREYVLNVETDLYGPYHSEEQARFAEQLIASKYPDLAKSCAILEVDLNSEPLYLLEPRLLY